MEVFPGILALLVAVAGWYYMFYSKAAQRLAGVEQPRVNQKRVRLRRLNGLVMFLFAVDFYAGFYTVRAANPAPFVIVWMLAIALLVLMVALALADLRITAKLRRRGEDRPRP